MTSAAVADARRWIGNLPVGSILLGAVVAVSGWWLARVAGGGMVQAVTAPPDQLWQSSVALLAIGVVTGLVLLRSPVAGLTAAALAGVGIVFGLAGGRLSFLLEFGRIPGSDVVLSADPLSVAVRELGFAISAGAFEPAILMLSASWIAIAANSLVRSRRVPS